MFQFPPSPIIGQEYNPGPGIKFRWSGTAWHLIGGVITQAEADLRYVFKAGDTMTGPLTAPMFVAPLLAAPVGSNLTLFTDSIARWAIQTGTGHLIVGADNTYDIGGVASRARTGYFGTGVVTSFVTTVPGDNLSLGISGIASWRINGVTQTLSPLGDNDRDLGTPSLRTRNIYAGTGVVSPSLDSGNGATHLILSTPVGGAQLRFAPGGAIRWGMGDTGTIFPAPDNLYDIGIAGTNRVRNIYFGNLLVGNQFEAPAGFNHMFTQGANDALRIIHNAAPGGASIAATDSTGAVAFRPLQISGDGLLFQTETSSQIQFSTNVIPRWVITNVGHFVAAADNTVDIGAGGTNRPRHLYLAGVASVASSVLVGGAGDSSNAIDILRNSTIGSESNAGLAITDGTSDVKLQFGVDNILDVSFIQSLDPGTSYATRPLRLQPNGGQVFVGSVVSDGSMIHVGGVGRFDTRIFSPLLRLPHGAAPGAPVDGDLWTTTAGLFARINGATVGPFGAAGAGIVVGTPQATTSGTAKDFTGIPSSAKRITVLLKGVSTNGAAGYLLQLGPAGGIETTGYAGGVGTGQQGQAWILTDNTTGFLFATALAANTYSGALTFTLENAATNSWCLSGLVYNNSGTVTMHTSSGAKSLAGVLDRLRLTTVGGTDTFDAGEVNITYES